MENKRRGLNATAILAKCSLLQQNKRIFTLFSVIIWIGVVYVITSHLNMIQ